VAKSSSIEKNKKRIKMSNRDFAKRKALKDAIRNREVSVEDRFDAVMKLAAMPRNGAKVRVRNRCLLSGRARGVYRKLKLSRIALRELASLGQIPGMTKSSW